MVEWWRSLSASFSIGDKLRVRDDETTRRIFVQSRMIIEVVTRREDIYHGEKTFIYSVRKVKDHEFLLSKFTEDWLLAHTERYEGD